MFETSGLPVQTTPRSGRGLAAVWDDAKQNALTIVSKDGDFHQRSFLYGYPPKVIWIRRGNCSTTVIERMLRDHHADINAFLANPVAAFLALA